MIENLLKRGPGQMVAFVPQPDASSLAETMIAFANADGGTILIGLNEQGQVVDYMMDEAVQGHLVRALLMCRPPVVTDWEQYELPGGIVVALKIARSPELHALADGRVLIRAGVENRPMGGEAIRHLAATKSSGDFESEPVSGATLVDLDKTLLDEYMRHRAERGYRSTAGGLQDHLVDMGAMIEDGTPTVAGMLLFGKHPQTFLPQSGLIFVKFLGKEARGRDGLAGYGRRVEVEGPAARIIERAWQVVNEEMRVEAVVNGLKREEMPEYPRFAVREALVNAVCHRDYRLSGRRVEIRMYEDRLEVISPGGLIRPGDRVDVVAVVDVQYKDLITDKEFTETRAFTIAQTIQVLAVEQSLERQLAPVDGGTATESKAEGSPVDQPEPEPEGTVVTLALTPEATQQVLLTETKGKIRLVVRAPGDTEIVETEDSTFLSLADPTFQQLIIDALRR